jgi:hypothetical protein
LKKLNLDDNAGIDDSVVDALAVFKGLEFLHLGKTKMTDAGISQLVNLPKLKDLIVNDTAVSDVAVKTLTQKLPGLKVRK